MSSFQFTGSATRLAVFEVQRGPGTNGTVLLARGWRSPMGGFIGRREAEFFVWVPGQTRRESRLQALASMTWQHIRLPAHPETDVEPLPRSWRSVSKRYLVKSGRHFL